MARYDYRCAACGDVFEVEHAMGEKPEVKCPKCGGETARSAGQKSPAKKRRHGPGRMRRARACFFGERASMGARAGVVSRSPLAAIR